MLNWLSTSYFLFIYPLTSVYHYLTLLLVGIVSIDWHSVDGVNHNQLTIILTLAVSSVYYCIILLLESVVGGSEIISPAIISCRKPSVRPWLHVKQENPAVARKPRDAAAVLFSLKFADDIHYKFKSSQASKARLQSSKHTGTKQN